MELVTVAIACIVAYCCILLINKLVADPVANKVLTVIVIVLLILFLLGALGVVPGLRLG